MNYDLAQQLRDERFPIYDGDGTWGGDDDGKIPTYFPSLEEIISECSKNDYYVLLKTDGKWMTGTGTSPIEGFSSKKYVNPWDAVANLWLIINKK